MKENKLTIVINAPIEQVFEFTINPKNTHLWVPSIAEEIANEYPPKVGTTYQNRGKTSVWNYYKVIEYSKNKVFALSDLASSFSVRYSYTKLGSTKTELEYFEWVKTGDLATPFTGDVLLTLKSLLENKT